MLPGCAGPESAQGADRGVEPGQQQRGTGGGPVDPGSPPRRVSPAVAALQRRFEELFGAGEPFLAHRRLQRLLDRMDRYAAFGRGQEGAGLELALVLVDGQAERCRWERGVQRPRSLAYFIPLLEEISRTWRRTGAEREEQVPPGWRSTWAAPKRKKGRRRGGNHGAGGRSTNAGG